MKWTTELPKVPGYYWILTTPEYENDPEVYCVNVAIYGDKPSFCFPVDGFECEDKLSVDRTTHWYGPIEEPAPPNTGMNPTRVTDAS